MCKGDPFCELDSKTVTDNIMEISYPLAQPLSCSVLIFFMIKIAGSSNYGPTCNYYTP